MVMDDKRFSCASNKDAAARMARYVRKDADTLEKAMTVFAFWPMALVFGTYVGFWDFDGKRWRTSIPDELRGVKTLPTDDEAWAELTDIICVKCDLDTIAPYEMNRVLADAYPMVANVPQDADGRVLSKRGLSGVKAAVLETMRGGGPAIVQTDCDNVHDVSAIIDGIVRGNGEVELQGGPKPSHEWSFGCAGDPRGANAKDARRKVGRAVDDEFVADVPAGKRTIRVNNRGNAKDAVSVTVDWADVVAWLGLGDEIETVTPESFAEYVMGVSPRLKCIPNAVMVAAYKAMLDDRSGMTKCSSKALTMKLTKAFSAYGFRPSPTQPQRLNSYVDNGSFKVEDLGYPAASPNVENVMQSNIASRCIVRVLTSI